VIRQWAAISERAGEIVPAYGFTQAERETGQRRPDRQGRGGAGVMREAVIVSTARTPIGRAYRGAFNDTPSPTLAAHALTAAVERAGRRAGRDRGLHPGLLAAAGLSADHRPHGGRCAPAFPVTVPGMTMDRQCSSGLMTIATAAKQIIVDRMDVIVAGGVESISLVQTPEMRVDQDPGSWPCTPTPTCRCWTRPRRSPPATGSAARPAISTRCPRSIARRRPRRRPLRRRDRADDRDHEGRRQGDPGGLVSAR
jgi:hypothetical protein